jgi:rod shape-determining protein MreD
MRVALAVVVPVLAAALQASVVATAAIGEARPDLVALVVVGWALLAGAPQGAWWAFVGGIASDLWSGAPFGANTISLLPIGAAFGAWERQLEPGILAGAGLIALGSSARQFLYILVLAVLGRPLPELGALALSVVGGAAFTGVLALALYPGLRALNRRTRGRAAFD